MISVIAWKEWRQQIAFVFAILAMAGIAMASSAYFVPHEWERRSQDVSAGALWVILLIGMAIAQGVVTGALLFAGEAEDNTQDFLDQHAALGAGVEGEDVGGSVARRLFRARAGQHARCARSQDAARIVGMRVVRARCLGMVGRVFGAAQDDVWSDWRHTHRVSRGRRLAA